MSDIRFIMAGVALVFAGFLVLGIFGDQYRDINVQNAEFNNCMNYSEDNPPEPTDCGVGAAYSLAFFGLVLGLIGSGIFALIKGYRGKWDNEVPAEDMVGPGHRN